jgi:hypothetical protein
VVEHHVYLIKISNSHIAGEKRREGRTNSSLENNLLPSFSKLLSAPFYPD